MVLCGKLEEDLRVIVGCSVEVYRRDKKINAGKRNVMILNGEEGLGCEVSLDGMQLKHVSELEHLE